MTEHTCPHCGYPVSCDNDDINKLVLTDKEEDKETEPYIQ